ncbi:MAG: glycosyltransferase family 39 protein [Acidobacteria bacterium]|nr:glycosyltransferase family 39 protein [Acidobacteriota bacterium]
MKKNKQTNTKPPEPVFPKTLWLVVALAALLRIGYWLEIRTQPDYAAPWIDAAYHDVWARQIAFGELVLPEGINDPHIDRYPYFRPPGYPFFLAAIYKVTGGHYDAPRIVQFLLGLLNIFLVFMLVQRFANRRAALFAAAWCGLYPISIYFEGELLAAAPLATGILLVIWAHEQMRQNWNIRMAWLSGVGLGLLCLFRPNFLLMVPPLALWLAWSHRRNRTHLWLMTQWAIGLFLAIVPCTLRNLIKTDDLVLISSNGGINLYIGNHHQADGFSATIQDLGAISGLNGWTSFDFPALMDGVSKRQGRPMKASEVSRHFSSLAWDEMTRYPGITLKRFIKKALHFWNAKEISNNKEVSVAVDQSWALTWLPGFGLLFVCAALGFAVLQEKQRVLQIVLWLAVSFVSYLPFFVTGRFRAPLLPLLAMLAGMGVDAVVARQLKWRAALVGVLAAMVTVTTAFQYSPDTAVWHYHQGISHETQGRDDLARQSYLKALDANPTFVDAALKLGNLAYRLGDEAHAYQYWKRAVDHRPQAESLNNLAWLLATTHDQQRRNPNQAIDYASRAVAMTGRQDSGKLDTLAEAYFSAGQRNEAKAIWLEAIRCAEGNGNQEEAHHMKRRLDELGLTPR